LQSPSTIKDISIKSNKTFLLEFFNHFFYVYSNKTIENFKKKNINNFNTNCLNSLNIEYLYKNKICNSNNIINNEFSNQIFFPKISSEHSLNLIDDNKKIINDNNKVFDWNENINNSGDINYPKLSFFGNSSFNNLSSPEPLFNFKNLPSKSLSTGINRVPSFGNINNYNNFNSNCNINFTPNKNYNILDMYMNSSFNSMTNLNNLNQMNNMNINNIKNSNANLLNNSNNNLLQINRDKIVKSTLLSPPPQIPFSLGKAPIIPIAEKNNTNFNIVDPIKDKSISNNSEKNSNTLNMFNKKRKRDIKNNKYVFFLGDNKKEKKEKEQEQEQEKSVNNVINTDNTDTTPNQTQTANMESNDYCSEKSKKPRGSKFRGVSRNGNQWQVLIMVNKKKRYVGSYSKEEEAAKAYDKVALQNHGSKAKTNFDYTKQEVESILASPQLLKLY